ncbi:hypothetical protein TWF481_001886 [Arthrobotrys musiformis]|uniref:Uncharacterized protein n=1 Tax=Arthrobotrys musiformis TaxID=47236 RepID=A0AAV9VUS0_9PEZI
MRDFFQPTLSSTDLIGLVAALLPVIEPFYTPAASLYLFIRLYGVAGIVGFWFGNIETWKTLLEVLARLQDEDALAFKKWIIDEYNMTAIAGAIIAQLVISSLSLDLLNETHWSARACLMYSLVASLMAVYFAATQSRKLGRLFKGTEIRAWIRKGRKDNTEEIFCALKAVKTSEDYEECERNCQEFINSLQSASAEEETSTVRIPINFYANLWTRKPVLDPRSLQYIDVLPAPTSLLSLSAPSMLLSTSVFAFLAGIGVYLGFLYTKKLGLGSGVDDDRNVFFVYVIGLGICGVVYLTASRSTAEGKGRIQRFDYQLVRAGGMRGALLKEELDNARRRAIPVGGAPQDRG